MESAANVLRHCCTHLATVWQVIITTSPRTHSASSVSVDEQQVEDLPFGYPQYVAFIASHPSFHIFRRFASLRARILLSKQDRLVELEKQLERIDRDEVKPLFLSSIRRDKNDERKKILKDIDIALAEYDALSERNAQAFARDQAKERDVVNLQNWLANTGSVARQETDYIGKKRDLMSIGNTTTDSALDAVSGKVERILTCLPAKFAERSRVRTSRDDRIWIFPDALVQRFGRILLACVLVTLLLTPIGLINSMKSVKARFFMIWASSAVFIFVIAVATKAKTAEVFVAGTTYATVLVVFIAGNGDQ